MFYGLLLVFYRFLQAFTGFVLVPMLRVSQKTLLEHFPTNSVLGIVQKFLYNCLFRRTKLSINATQITAQIMFTLYFHYFKTIE